MPWSLNFNYSFSYRKGYQYSNGKVIDKNTVYTSESGYGGKAFWNQTRSNSNGRWGANSNYKFLGFIYNPAIKDEVKVVLKSTDAIAKEVIEGKWGNGADRKSRLTAAGYNYSEVQKEVNKIYENK